MAPDESNLNNATVLAGVLPKVDAIIQTLDYNATDEIVTFSASMDAGARLHPDNADLARPSPHPITNADPDCDPCCKA